MMLVAISSPEMDDDEMDRGYSRHKAVEKKVVQKVPQSIPLSDQAKNAAASVTNATQKSAPSTVKEAAKDPGRARIMKGKTIAETLLPKKDMPPSTKTAFMGNSTPLSKMSKKKDKGKNSPPSIPIVVQVLADDIIPVPIRRKSTIATALQDVSNTFTPMTRTPQPVNLKRTYASRSNGKKAAENHDALVSTTVAPEINDENTDPLEQNSQPTTANNSRRRSYKSGPSIAARIPSGKITILPLSGTKKRDSLIGMSAARQLPRIRDLTVTPSARETINEEMEGEVEANKENEFQKLLKIRSVSTTKTARMRTNTCSEEENEVPKDSANVRVDIPRGTQILTSSKDNLNERRGRSKRRARDSAAYRLREDATLVDEAQNDYNDADDEISSSPEKDIVDDENKDKTLLKRSRKSSDGDLAASSVPPTEATSQSTSTPLLSWRPSAGLTTFSSPDQSSNTDDSAEKVVQSAAISATSGLGSKGIEKDKTTIKPPVLPLMVPQPPCQEKIQSPSQDGNDSTYSRSEASDHYAQKRSKGAAERDSRIKYSSSDEDGPSSDEDGVIAM